MPDNFRRGTKSDRGSQGLSKAVESQEQGQGKRTSAPLLAQKSCADAQTGKGKCITKKMLRYAKTYRSSKEANFRTTKNKLHSHYIIKAAGAQYERTQK